jgi:hypothetical protein
MNKKHFIAIAQAIRDYHDGAGKADRFSSLQLATLADSFASLTPQFDRQKWLDFIAGKVSPSGVRIQRASETTQALQDVDEIAAESAQGREATNHA